MTIIKEISDLYIQNAEKDAKISLLRRKFVEENELLLEKLTEELKKEVHKDKISSLNVEKLVRSIKNIRDGVEAVINTITDLKQEHKRLVEIIKAKEPSGLKKVKENLEQSLRMRGELE
jgi:hypothetical protein